MYGTEVKKIGSPFPYGALIAKHYLAGGGFALTPDGWCMGSKGKPERTWHPGPDHKLQLFTVCVGM